MKAAPRPKKKEDTWPRTETTGNVAVKIYRRKRADGSFGFEVADYTNGRRRLRSCKDLGAATAEAKRIGKQLSSGEFEAAKMKSADAASYGRAIELLRATGAPLEIAAAHFAKAVELLGGDKIVAAAEFYAKRNSETLTPRTVAEVVAEVLNSKDGKRARSTIADLRSRLTAFATAFVVDISSVTTADVQRWLDGLKASERTRLNYRNKVFQLFRFAERRNYIPDASNPVAKTERIEPPEGEITIYTPDEIERLLDHAAPKFRACIAIGAFAGLRRSEIERLDWQDINFKKGLITARGRKRGTPSRRFVAMKSNLRQWIEPLAKSSGFVWLPLEANRQQAHELYGDEQAAMATNAAVAWLGNALRHSFISYRCAEVENLPAVAMEAGNSESTINKHYRELVTKDDAETWFAVSPKTPKNIVQMKTA